MKKLLVAWSVLLMVGTCESTENILVSWESNGVLRATDMVPGSTCTVEWASSLTGGFSAFDDIVVNTNRTIDTEVPMGLQASFFRVRGESFQGMVFISAGANSGTDPDFGAYSLTVDAFYMDATEVTSAHWNTVRNWATENGYIIEPGYGSSNHPVQHATWYSCVKWCNARSEMGGRTPCYTVSGNIYRMGSFSYDGSHVVDCNFSANGYRLPTLAEWEYAARGGLNGKRFPWGDTITHSEANYYSDSSYAYDTSPTRGYHPDYDTGSGYWYTSPVGSFPPNGYGLYDMSGNVGEWCWDIWLSYRGFRGGAWEFKADHSSCGYRLWSPPNVWTDDRGFRAVCR